jgi:hypothetical protein
MTRDLPSKSLPFSNHIYILNQFYSDMHTGSSELVGGATRHPATKQRDSKSAKSMAGKPFVKRFHMKRASLIIQVIFAIIFFSILNWKQGLNIPNLRFNIIGLIFIALIIYSEIIAHKRRLSNWANTRIKGKMRFILYDYVLLRGGIVSVLIILILSIKVTIGLLIICTVIPLFGVMAFAGNEEWKKCEEKYTISTLKSLAEKIKVLRN